ncbi:Vegetative incompatibility protein HET-E-1 [Ceratobasidium sp. AG-Ba]|nr:Vegetative incompatibility protein HET-E-1 [Ceratobasidium sp. AG-Ba]
MNNSGHPLHIKPPALLDRLKSYKRKNSAAPQIPPPSDLNATTAPSSSNRTDEMKDNKWTRKLAWNGLRTFLRVLEKSADVFGPLKSAAERLSQCAELFEESSRRRKGYEELGQKLDQMLGDLVPFVHNLTRMGPAMSASVKSLCNAIHMELKAIEGLDRTRLKRHLDIMDDSDELLERYQRIYGHVERLTLNANLEVWKTVDSESTNSRLRQLSPTADYAYNSRISDRVNRGPCTEGTRRAVLEKLMNWACNPSSESIYWLNGMAGTGKTIIAYSLCTDLDATGDLAANFFCSRSIPHCRDVHMIIPAIAYQLAQFSNPFRFALFKALEQDHDLHTRRLDIQFRSLIHNPIEEVKHALPPDLIVVIDALDECEDSGSVGKILELLTLRSLTSNLPIRFLISSRPDTEIYSRLMKPVEGNPDANLVLHTLDPAIVKEDIEKYLRYELADIPLEPLHWTKLINRCGVLFIYASTAVRYIREGHMIDSLDEALCMVLGLTQHNSDESMEALDGLYATILRAAFEKTHIQRMNRDRIKRLLLAVICVQEPVTVEVLARLLELRSGEQVRALLQPLSSVIHVVEETGAVVTLHASFTDYVLSDTGSRALYHCNPVMCHNDLALACLKQIRCNEVQFNICGIESSYIPDSGFDMERARQNTSLTLIYACRYWAAHLVLGGQINDITEALYDFLTARVLLWIELLNLIHGTKAGVGIISRVEEWCKVST